MQTSPSHLQKVNFLNALREILAASGRYEKNKVGSTLLSVFDLIFSRPEEKIQAAKIAGFDADFIAKIK